MGDYPNPLVERSLGRNSGALSQVAASLTTALAGANNDLVYTAKDPYWGVGGNAISVRYVDPAGNNATLSVSVSGKDITVNLATGGAGAITSTAAQVSAAVAASAAAADLVSVANAAGNDGTGVVTALAKTNLTGGTTVAGTAWSSGTKNQRTTPGFQR